jgi:threonyl-tRNA synthetase
MEIDQNRENQIQIKRHSLAHLLAMACLAVFKDAKIGIGAAIENGFYQEVLIDKELTNEDLEKISDEMKKLIAAELPFQQITISKNEAFDILHLQGQIFKTEILEQIPDETVSFYKTGSEFFDLCKGPHVNHTGNLGSFLLTNVSKVYWNNDQTRPKLQRIYGVAFNTQIELDKFIIEQNEIREKNYLKTGSLIELFTLTQDNDIDAFLPKGVVLMDTIKEYVYKTNLASGFKIIRTPLVKLNKTTKTLDYPEFKVKDLISVYKSKKRSYKTLPFRLAQINYFISPDKANDYLPLLNQIYTQADIGIVIADKEDLVEQINIAVSKIMNIFKFLGLHDYKLELALKGNSQEKYFGNPKEWLKLESLMVDSVKNLGITVYEAVNTASDSGPGFNFIYEDIKKNRWKLATIEIDLKSSHEQNLKYIDEKGKEKEAFLISKSFITSIECVFALIIEKFQGAFPLWLSPVHVNVIPISKKYNNYAKEVYFKLLQEGLSATIDLSANTMQTKIKNSQQKLVPYMLILGQKEQMNHTASVRPRSDQELGMMKIDEFIGIIKQELRNNQTF